MNLQEVGRVTWTGLLLLGVGTGGGRCECGDELMVSIKCGDFVD